MNDGYMTRRALVKRGLMTGAVIPVTGLLIGHAAFAASPALDPNDPTAKALGYVTKSPKPDATCANCNQFQGKTGEAQGPCIIFPGKDVAAAGWCMSWVKKPAA